jgi:hypothetical protein
MKTKKIKPRSLAPKTLILTGCLLALGSCNFIAETWADAISGASKAMAMDGNSLYHQTDEVSLETGTLEVAGEVKNPGTVNLNNHYKREVFIKEARYHHDTGTEFIGSYRYRGYSLFDLLHPFNQDKKNAEEFRPAIDLYVLIENDLGETVAFSWSEIFHTINPHQVLIATEVAPIVPYRKEVDYPAGVKWKVVSAGDLFAWRTLENPVKITVRSFDKKGYPIDRDLEPMHSQYIRVVYGGAQDRDDMDWAAAGGATPPAAEAGSAAGGARLNEGVAKRPGWLDGLQVLPEEVTAAAVRYHSSFYGMGMGHHPTKYFEGPRLDVVLGMEEAFAEASWNRNGLVCFAGIDGYRAVFSFSELFNRADQVFPILAVPENPMDGGHYRIFHPSDFYADRSVKSVAEIYLFLE